MLKEWQKKAWMGNIEPGKGFVPRFKDIGKGMMGTGRGIKDLIKNLIESGVAVKDIIQSLIETFGGIANIPREVWWAVRKHFPPNARGRNPEHGGRYEEFYDLLP